MLYQAVELQVKALNDVKNCLETKQNNKNCIKFNCKHKLESNFLKTKSISYSLCLDLSSNSV